MDCFSSLLLFWDGGFALLASDCEIWAELTGHPSLGPIAKAALLIIPEDTLSKGLLHSLTGCWLPQEIYLV